MKAFRRWQRIFILFLLSVSVFAPILLVSNKLKSLTSDGRNEFVEDLSSIKHRRDVLPLNAVQQEAGEGVKEPKLEVYRDQNYSIVSFSKNGDGNSSSQDLGEENSNSTYGSERNGTERSVGEEIKSIQRKEEPSPRKLKNQNQRPIQQDRGVRAPGVAKAAHGQDPRTEAWRATDEKVKQMKDQLIRAKAYLAFATSSGNSHLVKELRLRMKELERAVGESRRDAELSKSGLQRMKNMENTLLRASHAYPHCSNMVNKLRAMTHSAEEQAQSQRTQTKFLTELAGRTTPKGLHCLSMRLTTEYFTLKPEEQVFPNQENVNNQDYLHFAVISDNILAAAVVVNSTVSNAPEPEKIAFHVVTDSLNFPAFSMWFLLNPPGKATIQVLSAADFEWLPDTHAATLVKQKSLDPRFSSPLNHLRFYLPEIFPQLSKIVFLDHDVVVQGDLSGLWAFDMKGKVNGAVETCQEGESSYRRMDMLINFSDPSVATKYDANACTWAYGMNLFDLGQWRGKDLASSYRRLLLKGNGRALWTAGTLPLGWLTFYNQTVPLDRRWHLLGLGYDSQLRAEEIQHAAVIHYDGIMKPWLDIGIRKYKGYWNKYVSYDHPYLQQCNLHG